jgi:SAM-dependent MidA family methyltransferase
MSVAEYMQACLNDPEHGYYTQREAIGRAGDFITAPEISQVFGELVGLWCAVVWRQMGEPRSVRIVELGPGRGTLMRDALRAARAVAAFRSALRVHLVESNATLAALQRTALDGEDVPVSWSGEMDASAGAGPAIVIANEFLDTLPVAQWVWRGGRWLTRCVGLEATARLAFVDGEPVADPDLPQEIAVRAREGDVFETRAPALEAFAAKVAALGAPIAALFIDYGHVGPALGDTLQAIRAHRYDNPLSTPGEADLTAQVDFAAVAAAMHRRGLACDGPATQAEFLGSLGAAERASHLMAANPAKAAQIEAAVARLMAPGGMGTRFHAIGVRSGGIGPLPGFGAVDIRAPAP